MLALTGTTLLMAGLTGMAPSGLAAQHGAASANAPQAAERHARNVNETGNVAREKAEAHAKARRQGERRAGAKRARVMEEAIAALRETRNAIAALERKDAKAALAAIEKAIGKLEVILARDPRLALAPVDVASYTLDIYGDAQGVRKAVDTAVRMLREGRVQDARALVSGLASEIVIEVANIPLATYPDALKAVVPLIEAENHEAASRALTAALNTLVITRHVIPLPVVRAEHLLELAEKLAEKKQRDQRENAKLKDLLEAARMELELAQALGYGKKEDFDFFYAQLDEISGKTRDGGHGSGFFDRLRKALEEFRARMF